MPYYGPLWYDSMVQYQSAHSEFFVKATNKNKTKLLRRHTVKRRLLTTSRLTYPFDIRMTEKTTPPVRENHWFSRAKNLTRASYGDFCCVGLAEFLRRVSSERRRSPSLDQPIGELFDIETNSGTWLVRDRLISSQRRKLESEKWGSGVLAGRFKSSNSTRNVS